jgi:sodium pump decarboxylase gamma subunit
MSDIQIGLYIGLLGMSVLFIALGALALMIMLLDAIFRPKPPKEAEVVEAEKEAPLAASRREFQLVAAVAVAVSHLLHKRRPQADLGRSLEQGPGRYWERASEHQTSLKG